MTIRCNSWMRQICHHTKKQKVMQTKYFNSKYLIEYDNLLLFVIRYILDLQYLLLHHSYLGKIYVNVRQFKLITFNKVLHEEKYQSRNGSKILPKKKERKTFCNCFWKNELWWRFSLKISIALEKMKTSDFFNNASSLKWHFRCWKRNFLFQFNSLSRSNDFLFEVYVASK